MRLQTTISAKMIVNAQTCDKNRVSKQASKGERANARRGIPLLKNFELIRHTSVVCNDLFFHHRCYRPQHPRPSIPSTCPTYTLPSCSPPPAPLPLSSLALPPPPRAARHAARLTCLLLLRAAAAAGGRDRQACDVAVLRRLWLVLW